MPAIADAPAAGPMLGTPATGSMLLAGEHFAAAMLFLIAGAAGLVWIAPELAAGAYLVPRVAGVTHLFTLGWLTTTIFGALHQLLPVALGAPVRWPGLGHASFAAFAPGAALFATGVATGSAALHHAGVALVTVGIVAAVVNFGATLARAPGRDTTWWAVALALVALASTLALGVALLHNLHTGYLAGARVRVLAIHLHVALVGWALLVVVGMSRRLLPMFLLSHGVGDRWSRVAVALLSAGTTTLGLGLARTSDPLAWGGAALLVGGVAAFLVQARLYFRHRVRRRLDAGLRFAATALVFLGVAAAAGPAVLAVGATTPRLATAYLLAGLLGGIVLYVVGHFYKIVPFLAWIARYHGRVGREPVPTIADLYSSRVATVQWLLMTAAVVALVAGTMAGHAHCTRAGAALFALAVGLFASQVARVASTRPPTSP
jgi:hypothetical protein